MSAEHSAIIYPYFSTYHTTHFSAVKAAYIMPFTSAHFSAKCSAVTATIYAAY